jgi:hypothetical protein
MGQSWVSVYDHGEFHHDAAGEISKLADQVHDLDRRVDQLVELVERMGDVVGKLAGAA